MNINAISGSRTFGNLYIAQDVRRDLVKSILKTSASEDTYKEAIADMLEVEDDKNVLLSVYKIKDKETGIEAPTVDLKKLDERGHSYLFMSSDFGVNFLNALKKSRSKEYKAELCKIRGGY